MKCPSCKRKMGIVSIACKYCTGKYCTSCINLEKHSCGGIATQKQISTRRLELQLLSCVVTKKEKLLPSP